MPGNRIDLIRPDAPELAARGPFAAGVRTIEIVNPDQADVANVEPGRPHPRKDRRITLEVWYPAQGPAGECVYPEVVLRDGRQKVDLRGTALRDAPPAPGGPWPVAVISHGYPGNRFLLSHLGENLATKGYVVVSADHPDSTYDDHGPFGATLLHRPLDQLFIVEELHRLAGDGGHFLHGVADAERIALIGYSMGGYGAVVATGGGVTREAVDHEWSAPDGLLERHLSGSQSHLALPDPRVKAAIAFAPWGMQRDVFDRAGLGNITVPFMVIAGDVDDISGYEQGPKALFEHMVNSDSALLTYRHANHNAGAPIPAPAEAWQPVDWLDFVPFEHYADPVWDSVRMNNIAQHFVTAWLGLHLKGDKAMEAYLDLVEEAAAGVWSVDENGTELPGHSYWKGFGNRTAAGLAFERRRRGS
jgi:predicted dienelactone hydrolase